MRESDQQYTWRLSAAVLRRLAPAERRRIELVASVEPHVRKYLAVAIRDPDERAEAIADALTAAFEAAESESASESARALALASARQSSNRWKQRQRRLRRPPAVDPTCDAGISELDVREYRLRLWGWLETRLATLREEESLALELHIADDRTDEEIAEMLGCRPATVRKWRERGKRTIRQLADREGVLPSRPDDP